jgi:Pentapeptide repeats (8 copies)
MGGARVAVRLSDGRRAELSRPRFARGRLGFRLRGSAARTRAARVGDVHVRAVVARRARVVGRCPLVPFIRCIGMRAHFADLFRADLRGADLRHADLHRAYAHAANLVGADLRGADLRGAHLIGADLREARLSGANLADAVLRLARVAGAGWRGAYLCGARLARGMARVGAIRDCDMPSPRRVSFPRPRAIRLVEPSHAVRRPAAAPSAGASRVEASTAHPRLSPRTGLARAIARQRGLARRAERRQARQAQAVKTAPTARPPTRIGTTCSIAPRSGAGRSKCSRRRACRRGPPNSAPSTPTPRTPTATMTGCAMALSTRPPATPRQDTDLDGVADLDEYALYASKLYHADGDGDSLDASGNRDPSLFDGQEVNRLQTSPADTDTDGDSFTDL